MDIICQIFLFYSKVLIRTVEKILLLKQATVFLEAHNCDAKLPLLVNK